MSFIVTHGGVLALLQDRGRFGQHRIGLTNGGPLDPAAFDICRRLLGNAADSTAIEISFGGLQLEAEVDTYLCLTGAPMGLQINGEDKPRWRVLRVKRGDCVAIAHASSGCRAYLGVAGGFHIPPSFGSSATVLREHIGGLGGGKLQSGDKLPCAACASRPGYYLPDAAQPSYQKRLQLRVLLGYQQAQFSNLQQRLFFSSEYTVSDRSDRMGYRLTGTPIQCDVEGILSEGICQGAIQIPADGQPIVLLNDRQTIGGYPKIGSVLSLDLAKLAQLPAGGQIHFSPIDINAAHNALHLAAYRAKRLPFLEYKV